jgi:integrase
MSEAAAWRAARLADVDAGRPFPALAEPQEATETARGTDAPPLPLTVAEAARELVHAMLSGATRDRQGRRYKPSSVRSYEASLRLHVLTRIGAVPVASLRRGDVRRLLAEISAGASPHMAREAHKALSVVLRRLVDHEVIAANVCHGLRVPTEGRFHARFLTPEEAERVQAAADADHDPQTGPLIALALATGLRRGEIQALVWGASGLDLGRGVVRVEATIDPKEGRIETKNRERREVVLGPGTAAAMRRWLLASGRPPDGAVAFPRHARHGWQRAREAAELAGPLPRFHDLRHSCATFLLGAGLTVHAVAELLGNTPALILSRYGHALPDELAGAGQRLEGWLAERRP